MAQHYSNGVAKNGKDLLVKARDFLVTTCGWTSLQDIVTDGSDTQYVACSSSGEDGLSKNVIRLQKVADTIQAFGYLSWAAGVGKNEISKTANVNAQNDNYVAYWMFGNLDMFVLVTSVPTAPGYSALYAGKYKTVRQTLYAVTANAEAAGSGVVVELNRTDLFTVGKRYILAGDNGYEFPKVTAINPGVSVTLDVLQNSYLAGARFGEDPRPLVVSGGLTSALGIGLTNASILTPQWTGGVPVSSGPQVGNSSAAIRSADLTFWERASGPEQVFDGGPDIFSLHPLFVCGEGLLMNAGLYGTLIDTFITSRTGLATDDTLTVGSDVYHYINCGPLSITTGPTGFGVGLAVRRSP